MTPDELSRFVTKIRVNPVSGCWEWTASKFKSTGYGRFKLQHQHGADSVAHRVSYNHWVGIIPKGLFLDHECHNSDKSCPGGKCVHRSCVNPDHLKPKTQRENLMASELTQASILSVKTHCPQGHPYDKVNTYLRKNGNRECVTCRREAARRFRERNQ